MEIVQAMRTLGASEGTASFDIFAKHLDREWINQALQATGNATVRRRKLPAEYVVWTVIGMGLLRDRSIQEVVRHLDLVLPDSDAPLGRGTVTGGAVVQARDRLGEEPMAWLFARTATHWAHAEADAHRWRGLALYGVDGSTLRIPDTKENEDAFGRPKSSRGRTAYPQLRFVALMALRSHLIAGAAIGPCGEGEITVAEPLWDQVPDGSLTVLDRGFISYQILHRLHRPDRQRHWLVRAKKNLKWDVVRQLGPNDYLVDLPVTRKLRQEHPEMPERIQARALRYQRRGFRPQMLLTSLLDATVYPASELCDLYHERWELEMGFDEIKTHTLEREEALLRSRNSERVRQEFWGLAIGYNLVRLEMTRVARQAGVSPWRISYRHALMLIRNFWVTAWLVSPGNLSKRLEALHAEMSLLILPKRRPRRFPRVVKIKMSNYPLKRKPCAACRVN